MKHGEVEFWTLCRTLGNAMRIRLAFLAIDGGKSGVNVSRAAEAVALGEPAASTYLKQLSAHGILLRQRSGLSVNYVVYGHGAGLPRKMLDILMKSRSERLDADDIAAFLHALGNATRIETIRAMKRDCGDIAELSRRILVPQLTLFRQMKVLVDAQIAVAGASGRYRLLPQSGWFRNAILDLVDP